MFGGHLLAENYRWIPVVGSLALLLWNSSLKKIAIPLTLGYVDSPYPARTLGRTTSTLSDEADYTVIIPHSHKLTGVFLEMVQAALPSPSVLGGQNTIIEGEFKVDLYRITATQ